jgi:DNA (cytosine-5)-methyltransferase 1
MPLNMAEEPILTAVDVFAGGGGLTVGLKRAGFRVVGAIEIEPAAFSTYKSNHPEVPALKQDVRTVRGRSLLSLASGRIDLLAGCPPCQGFCSLTHTAKRRDPRNALVREMGRLVAEVRPSAFMMENVPGLASRGKRLFKELLATLEKLKYEVRWGILQAADYGVPQYRRRLVLLAGRGFSIPLPEPTHDRAGRNNRPKWRTLRDAIGDMGPAVTLAKAKETGGPQLYGWHVVRNLTKPNVKRLKAALPGRSRAQLPKKLRPKCHQDSDEGFTNVYGRMRWDQVPVTITAGCTTPSKGRFGHPDELRTISVREAARIQTFPDDYLFDSCFMDYVCDMIGNALPCHFAEVLARQVINCINNIR